MGSLVRSLRPATHTHTQAHAHRRTRTTVSVGWYDQTCSQQATARVHTLIQSRISRAHAVVGVVQRVGAPAHQPQLLVASYALLVAANNDQECSGYPAPVRNQTRAGKREQRDLHRPGHPARDGEVTREHVAAVGRRVAHEDLEGLPDDHEISAPHHFMSLAAYCARAYSQPCIRTCNMPQ